MRLLKKEIWKILFHQKALLWLVIFAIIKLLSVNLMNDTRPEYDGAEYRQFLKQYGGQLDDDKQKSFDECYKNLRLASKNIDDLEDDYAQKKISEKEYLKQLKIQNKIKNQQSLIEQFNDKMIYANKNLQKHFIIHNYGWEEILTRENLDIVLIVFIFVIMIPIFCSEYESEMQCLQLCSRYGRNWLITIKLAIGIIIATGMSIFSSASEYIFYRLNGGMIYGDAPVQALEFFDSSNLNCSLNELWQIVVISRCVGTIFLCITIYAVSILLKRSLLSIVANLLILIIPICFSNVSNLKYVIPLPTGLIYATGLFYPNQYDYNIPDDIESFSDIQKYISFPEFSTFQRNLVFGTVFLVMLVLVVLIYRGYKEKIHITNISQLSEKLAKKKLRSFSCIILAGCMLLTMSGCVRQRPTDDEKFSRIMHANANKTDEYEFDIDEANITAKEVSTGKQFTIIRDVFEQLDANENFVNLAMVVIENYLFYSKLEENEWQIHRVSLKDFEDKCVFTKELTEDALGGYYINLVSAENYFAVDVMSQKTYCIDRNTGEWTLMGNVGSITLGDYGNKAYYENQDNQLVEYDIHSGKEKIFEDIVLPSRYSMKGSMETYYIDDDFCYYINNLQNNYMYKYSFKDGSNVLYSKDKTIADLQN